MKATERKEQLTDAAHVRNEEEIERNLPLFKETVAEEVL